MDIRLVRQLWSTVATVPNSRLSGLDDSSLISSIIDMLTADPAFDPHNTDAISTYISTRMPLIRDMAQQV